MPYNLLLLPLLGGYVFARYWIPSRYYVLRAEKERLLIIAAISGLFWLTIAFAIVIVAGTLFPCKPERFCFPEWASRHAPFDFLGTSLLAFFLGTVSWLPLNWKRLPWSDSKKAIDRVIDSDKAPFELLLKKSQDEGKTVAVTLKNGKVYVGFVIHAFNPALPTKYIQLLPTKSGHRDEKTKWYVFTTPYLAALDKIDKDYEVKLAELDDASEKLDQATKEYEKNKRAETKKKIDHLMKVILAQHKELDQLSAVADDIGVVLAVSEIVSVSIYSEYVHANYFPSTPTA